ncbi:MAG TPA: hypothetical protein VIH04_05070 [Nitrosarchaeum sp.]
MVKKSKSKQLEITAIELIGYDQAGNKINLSDCISKDADGYLSQDIEEFIEGVNFKKNGRYKL